MRSRAYLAVDHQPVPKIFWFPRIIAKVHGVNMRPFEGESIGLSQDEGFFDADNAVAVA